jgi:hypothetical protein
MDRLRNVEIPVSVMMLLTESDGYEFLLSSAAGIVEVFFEVLHFGSCCGESYWRVPRGLLAAVVTSTVFYAPMMF